MKMELIRCLAISLMVGSLIYSLLAVMLVFHISHYMKTEKRQDIPIEQVKDQDVTEEQKAIDKKRKEKKEAKDAAKRKAEEEAEEAELERQAQLTLARNFKSMGVMHTDKYRFTWYSSNVLHHYRTEEWTPDEAGMYRDSDGYIVVASYIHKQGITIDTPFGMGKVYDKCETPGTIDIYVNW